MRANKLNDGFRHLLRGLERRQAGDPAGCAAVHGSDGFQEQALVVGQQHAGFLAAGVLQRQSQQLGEHLVEQNFPGDGLRGAQHGGGIDDALVELRGLEAGGVGLEIPHRQISQITH